MIRRFTAAFAVLSLAACNSNSAETPAAEDTVVPDFPEPTVAGGTAIPVAMQGRWGLVPADCTSTQGDAKGLIALSAGTITFYESRATLGEVKESSDTNLVASFAFTGEGQEWTVEEHLTLGEDGKLSRTEQGEGAMAGTLVYSRCESQAG